MKTPLLTFTSISDNPIFPVWERLSLAPDGQAGLWITAAADSAERARGGSHLMQLAPPEQEQAQTLAQLLLNLPEDADHAPGRGVLVEKTLLVESGDQRRGFNLNYREEDARPEAIAAAIAFEGDMREKLLASPAAVVALNVRQAEVSGHSELVFSCKSIGNEMVEFQMDPDGLEIRSRGAMGWQVIWQPGGKMTLGLVAKMGVMVDGLYAPAQLASGETGSLVLPLDASLAPPSEGEQIWARLTGRIQLVGTGIDDDNFPDTVFVVECPLTV